jgi:hypothetical protein
MKGPNTHQLNVFVALGSFAIYIASSFQENYRDEVRELLRGY